MILLRRLGPAVAAVVAALIFALVRPGLTDVYDKGTQGRLHWASTGLVIWAIFGIVLARADYSARDFRNLARIGLLGLAPIVLSVLVLSYPKDADRVASTLWTVVLAVSIIGGLWVVLNLLVDRAKTDWRLFASVISALIAAVFFAILRGNLTLKGLFADDDPLALFSGTGFLGHVEWPIAGAVIWGGAIALITTLKQGLPRVAIGAASGLLTGWLIGDNIKPWLSPQLEWVELILFTVIFAAIGGALRWRSQDWAPGVVIGAALGWTWAAWFTSSFGGSESDAQVAAMVPLFLLGARLGWGSNPNLAKLSRFDNRARAFIFLGPAILFISSALFIPAVITLILSLKDRDGLDFVFLDNYEELLRDADSFNVANWANIFTSQLFWVAAVLVTAGAIIGFTSGKKRHGVTHFERTGSAMASMVLGTLLLSFAVFSVLRGTFFNNLWWVVTVTTISTTMGLVIAVLAERAGRLESFAKALIFMPMAVSFVGASIVWRLQYQARDPSKPQTGVLNGSWVQLGKLSHSGWPRIFVLVVLAALIGFTIYKAIPRIREAKSFAIHVGASIVLAYFFIELLRRSLGGFKFGPDGELLPDTVLFLQNPPFNNMFLMVVLIWIQTGFAMVILSAAIKAVPEEYIEAARVDGATESQTFFNITLPQILPTIGVVVTTLIVLVTKVFDIVKVTTGGNFGTDVLANDMFQESFSFFNRGLGSAIAVFILISVLPVMVLNIRRMQRERLA